LNTMAPTVTIGAWGYSRRIITAFDVLFVAVYVPFCV
jgi:hypothetical protein